MARNIITGFHAIEERIRRALENSDASGYSLSYSKAGPRVKKILQLAKEAGISASQVDEKSLDSLVQNLPPTARDHRGLVLAIEGGKEEAQNSVDFDSWVAEHSVSESPARVIILDSVTDPHNVGAIFRSCDQFGADLVVMPSRRSANDFSDNEIIARSSAGSSAWVPATVVTNLNRAVKQLKDAGFWVYGADAGGTSIQNVKFAAKSVVIMGSEGTGMSRIIKEDCDEIISIPTCGKIDSLNVSVAAGVLLYEMYRRTL